LAHPNILPLLGVDTASLQFVSEWMPGGNLPDCIEGHSGPDRLGLLSGTAKGLYYLHSRNVIHGDLKGSNILVDDSGHARIAGFGSATVTRSLDSSQSSSSNHRYTALWAAPEVLNGGTYGKEADIFSFAMVMIEVFAGLVSLGGGLLAATILARTHGRRPPRPTDPIFTDDLWTLTQRCWNQDPRLRPDAKGVLEVLLPSPAAATLATPARPLLVH